MAKFLLGIMLAFGICSPAFADNIDALPRGAEIVLRNDGVFVRYRGQITEINPDCYEVGKPDPNSFHVKVTWKCPECGYDKNMCWHSHCQNCGY